MRRARLLAGLAGLGCVALPASAPAATTSAPVVNPGGTVTLTAAATASGYTWTGSGTFSAPASRTTSWTPPTTTGTYTARVQPAGGLRESVAVRVNRAPTVTGTTLVACAGQAPTVSVAATDDDPAALLAWTWDGGAPFGAGLTGLTRTEVVPVTARSLTRTVTVADPHGLSGAAQVRLTVPTPATGSRRASDTTPMRRQEVTLSAAVVSTCPAALEWDLDADGTYEAQGTTVKVVPQVAGATHVVRVRAADALGAGASVGIALRVEANRPPVGEPAAALPQLLLGEPTTLSAARVTDVDGDVAQIRWELDGDGDFDDATGPTATFVGARAGLRPAVRVVDDLGAVAEKLVPVAVAGPPSLGLAPGGRLATSFSTADRRLDDAGRKALRQTGDVSRLVLPLEVALGGLRGAEVEVQAVGLIARRLGLGDGGAIATGAVAGDGSVLDGVVPAILRPTARGARVAARVRRLPVRVVLRATQGDGSPLVRTVDAVLVEDKAAVSGVARTRLVRASAIRRRP